MFSLFPPLDLRKFVIQLCQTQKQQKSGKIENFFNLQINPID